MSLTPHPQQTAEVACTQPFSQYGKLSLLHLCHFEVMLLMRLVVVECHHVFPTGVKARQDEVSTCISVIKPNC